MIKEETSINNTFGSQLKKLRVSLNKSQVDFADLIGISQPAINNYEKGRLTPSIEAAYAIAIACNVSIDWLCGRGTDDSLKTMGDVADFLFNFYNIEQFHFQTAIQIPSEDNEDIYVQLMFSHSGTDHNPDPDYSKTICNLLKYISELNEQLRHSECSQEYYDTQKTMLIEKYRKLPITHFNLSGISENERLLQQIEILKNELKQERLKNTNSTQQ